MRVDDLLNLWNQSALTGFAREAVSLKEKKNKKNLGSSFFEEGVNANSFFYANYFPCFIGAYSYINSGGYVKNSFIGRYCSVGQRVTIGAAFHNVSQISTHPLLSRGIVRKTIVGNDVWIGDGAVILAGLRIGHGAIIGANAVVTKDVPPYAIMAGCPAKLIRYRFDDDIIFELLNLAWWDLAHDNLVEVRLLDILNQISILKRFGPNNIDQPVWSYL